MENVLTYITTKDKEEARKLAKELLKRRLVACVNIGGELESWYWWDEKIENASEVFLLAKSREDQKAGIIQCVTENHSYDCPCVVFLPLTGGNPSYLDWIQKNLNPSEKVNHHE